MFLYYQVSFGCQLGESADHRTVVRRPAPLASPLPVSLGHTLDLVLLLDGVAVGRPLCGVHDLVGQALGDGLDVAESSFTSTGGQEPDGHVDTTKRRDIDSLAADNTSRTNAAGILTGTGVDNGVDDDLPGKERGQKDGAGSQ